MNNESEFAAAIAAIPTKELSKLCKVSKQAAGAWKNGTSIPRQANMQKIAKRLGVSVTELAEKAARDLMKRGLPR